MLKIGNEEQHVWLSWKCMVPNRRTKKNNNYACRVCKIGYVRSAGCCPIKKDASLWSCWIAMAVFTGFSTLFLDGAPRPHRPLGWKLSSVAIRIQKKHESTLSISDHFCWYVDILPAFISTMRYITEELESKPWFEASETQLSVRHPWQRSQFGACGVWGFAGESTKLSVRWFFSSYKASFYRGFCNMFFLWKPEFLVSIYAWLFTA